MKSLTNEQEERVQQILEDAFENPEGVDELQTPEELHCFADTWNWDSGVEPLQRIIRNPVCDKATALLIYWRADVISFYSQHAGREEVDEYSVEVYDLIKEVEEKFVSGFYTQGNIRYDPAGDGADRWRQNREEHKQPIPEMMTQPTPGDTLECGDLYS